MNPIRTRTPFLLAALLATQVSIALAAPKGGVCYEYQYVCYSDPYQACQAVAKERRADKLVDNPYGTVVGAKDAGDKFWCKLADKNGEENEQDYGSKRLATSADAPPSSATPDAAVATPAAAPPPPWGKARIADIAKKKVIVGMHATVTLKDGANATDGLKLPAAFAQIRGNDKQVKALGNGGEAALLPQVQVRKGHQPSAGYLLKPQASQPSALEFVSWNTGEPVKDHNASHAEHQFYEYISSRGPWLAKVKSIDIEVYGRDVCAQCEADFRHLQEVVRGRNPAAVVTIRRAD